MVPQDLQVRLSALRVKAAKVGKIVHCALIMDEMSIRKYVERNRDKFLGLNGAERANLVREALHCIYETGVNVVSLTFDGCISNIAAANALGANLSSDKLKHFFPHTVTVKDVFVILDPCHMLMLVRNCLATKGSICDGDGGSI
ncbi:hypothetical protein AVEN_32994-1 [Araneus ventricosus]|uniref:Transposable element P transposase-like RNase H domain-containing protein n=1 Tax=Araneus ventricosus TaxID=182803 RepID=A0A4Y2IP49_ARAVE|nr:hypothetical protein AVEN_32994-1 [Araneus ventricosus]